MAHNTSGRNGSLPTERIDRIHTFMANNSSGRMIDSSPLMREGMMIPTSGLSPLQSFMAIPSSGRTTSSAYVPSPFPQPPQVPQPQPSSLFQRTHNEEVIHEGVNCDGCGQRPLKGIRYKCHNCVNFDLCTTCIERVERDKKSGIVLHDPTHRFLRISEGLPVYGNLPTYLCNRSTMVHNNVGCGQCGVRPIVGFRYVCSPCNLSLCEKCELSGKFQF
jgi:hypothetical protein